jgi:hypothetical protein
MEMEKKKKKINKKELNRDHLWDMGPFTIN